ncbi:CheW protein [Dethiosulfovibrio peptidovorans DSM 11002]|uniref:CheW protein n=1 Tax=Dethiosulfovibrio peptidovorans DSM 11002 TaxID=469381 RepID=D2Z5P6_9BACT|nr:CheW protein [Dethiosulfovibrio peptidovorans DSM 11002]
MGCFLKFYVGARVLALPVHEVDRIVPAVAVSPLNEPHPVVAGMINVEGEGVPLYDLRRVYREPQVEMGLDHRFILITWKDKSVALWVDGVDDVVSLSEDPVELPGSERMASMVFDDDIFALSVVSSEEIMDLAERVAR